MDKKYIISMVLISVVLFFQCTKKTDMQSDSPESRMVKSPGIKKFPVDTINYRSAPPELINFLKSKGFWNKYKSARTREDLKKVYALIKNIEGDRFLAECDNFTRFYFYFLKAKISRNAFFEDNIGLYAEEIVNNCKRADSLASFVVSPDLSLERVTLNYDIMDVYGMMKDAGKTIAQAKKIVEKWPRVERLKSPYFFSQGALNVFAGACEETGRFDEARTYLNQIEEKYRGTPLGLTAIKNLVFLYFKSNNEQGIKELDQKINKYYANTPGHKEVKRICENTLKKLQMGE